MTEFGFRYNRRKVTDDGTVVALQKTTGKRSQYREMSIWQWLVCIVSRDCLRLPIQFLLPVICRLRLCCEHSCNGCADADYAVWSVPR